MIQKAQWSHRWSSLCFLNAWYQVASVKIITIFCLHRIPLWPLIEGPDWWLVAHGFLLIIFISCKHHWIYHSKQQVASLAQASLFSKTWQAVFCVIRVCTQKWGDVENLCVQTPKRWLSYSSKSNWSRHFNPIRSKPHVDLEIFPYTHCSWTLCLWVQHLIDAAKVPLQTPTLLEHWIVNLLTTGRAPLEISVLLAWNNFNSQVNVEFPISYI